MGNIFSGKKVQNNFDAAGLGDHSVPAKKAKAGKAAAGQKVHVKSAEKSSPEKEKFFKDLTNAIRNANIVLTHSPAKTKEHPDYPKYKKLDTAVKDAKKIKTRLAADEVVSEKVLSKHVKDVNTAKSILQASKSYPTFERTMSNDSAFQSTRELSSEPSRTKIIDLDRMQSNSGFEPEDDDGLVHGPHEPHLKAQSPRKSSIKPSRDRSSSIEKEEVSQSEELSSPRQEQYKRLVKSKRSRLSIVTDYPQTPVDKILLEKVVPRSDKVYDDIMELKELGYLALGFITEREIYDYLKKELENAITTVDHTMNDIESRMMVMARKTKRDDLNDPVTENLAIQNVVSFEPEMIRAVEIFDRAIRNIDTQVQEFLISEGKATKTHRKMPKFLPDSNETIAEEQHPFSVDDEKNDVKEP